MRAHLEVISSRNRSSLDMMVLGVLFRIYGVYFFRDSDLWFDPFHFIGYPSQLLEETVGNYKLQTCLDIVVVYYQKHTTAFGVSCVLYGWLDSSLLSYWKYSLISFYCTVHNYSNSSPDYNYKNSP